MVNGQWLMVNGLAPLRHCEQSVRHPEKLFIQH
jgi:hypothetical protein